MTIKRSLSIGIDLVINDQSQPKAELCNVNSRRLNVTSEDTTTVELSDQFYGWVLGFGKKAKILWPENVVEDFKGYLDKIQNMYDH